MENTEAYRLAQSAIANLKAAIHAVLSTSPQGLTNAQIGRTLGIYSGHIRHEGHISRTLLAMLESEGVAERDPKTKCWRLKQHASETSDENEG
jgi:DNA-binding IclR family transcriptional regulator